MRSQETQRIEDIVENWAQARLEALAAEAGEVASRFYPVRAERAAPGAFAIEWFTRRWVNRTGPGAQTFTSYIRRGTGDRYPRSALAGVAQPWELEIADALEDRFGAIRRAARSVSRLRTAFRQHAKLERTMAE